MHTQQAKDECVRRFFGARRAGRRAAGDHEALLRPHVRGVGMGRGRGLVLLLECDHPSARHACRAQAEEFGVPVSYQVVGKVRVVDPTISRRARSRPAPAGVSVGHTGVTAGTLGAWVEDRRGDIAILSNNHVLANSNRGVVGDAVLQPGVYDGGRATRDTIAELVEFVRIDNRVRNRVDAAVARVLRTSDVEPEEIGLGEVKGTVQTAVGRSVRKSGRTTLVTQGQVSVMNALISVSYGSPIGTATFDGQIIVKPGGFSAGGDSGSLVMDTANRAVGLLFAGSNLITVVNPIADVVSKLGIRRFLGTGSGLC
jgi:hypothetical protein